MTIHYKDRATDKRTVINVVCVFFCQFVLKLFSF